MEATTEPNDLQPQTPPTSSPTASPSATNPTDPHLQTPPASSPAASPSVINPTDPHLQTPPTSSPATSPSATNPTDPQPQTPPTSSPKTSSTNLIDPLSNPYNSLNSYCHDLSTLQDLASRGAWRTILDKVSRSRSQSLLSKPHEHLIYLTFNVLALTKLRRFADASSDLCSYLENPDNLDSPQYLYSSYPSLYPSHPPHSSMIPFALRVLHAHLPFSTGQPQQGLDRLYALLLFTRSKQSENDFKIWRQREIFVLNMIINHHLSVKEFKVCLDLLRELLGKKEYAEDPRVVAKVAYVQMQYGDLDGARRTFGVVEGMMGEANEDVGLKNLVGRNKALMYIVEKDYVSAIREYEECIERDGSDAVAINNKALCLMYLRDLSDGIKVLENALERVPTAALNETVVINLCSMYELAYVNHADIKKTLSNWIARVAPDDFDTTCTRT